MYTHSKQIIRAGYSPDDAEQAIIMIHGRGASAANIVTLAEHLNLPRTAILAPQATNNSWYPYSFMAPVEDNQPALNSALKVIDEVIGEIIKNDIALNRIFFLGFSQGACLTLEYTARNAAKYGGIIAFTGGLIGETLNIANYMGDFSQTPFLITTGDPDPHVPLSRVEESIAVLKTMNAQVSSRVYRGKPHSISMEEIELANELILL